MATLQKIRDKSTLLLIIVGLALLAFIVGDALQSGGDYFSSSKNQIGEAAGEVITFKEYRTNVSENQQKFKIKNNIDVLDNEISEQIEEQTWADMISNLVLGKEYKNLGISLPDDEIVYLISSGKDPFINRFFNNADPTQISQWVSYINSENSTIQDKVNWDLFKTGLRQQNTQRKYISLIFKSIEPTPSIVNQLSSMDDKLMEVKYIVKSYGAISDSLISVSESEINQYYNENIEKFKQEASRKIEYVVFPVLPTENDFENAKDKINKYKSDFTTIKNTPRLVNRVSDVPFDDKYYSKTQIEDEDMALFAFSEKIGEIFGPVFNENTFTLSKINDTKMLSDSIRARHILITPRNKNQEQFFMLIDSIENLLNEPKADFEQLAKQFSEDNENAINGGDLGWFGPYKMIKAFSDTAFNAQIGEIKKVTTQYGIHFVEVTQKSKKVKKVQLATIKLRVSPSQKTFENIWVNASSFIEKVNTIDDFKNMALKENLDIEEYTLYKNTKEIPEIQNSLVIIKQAFRSKDENVFLKNFNNNSPIFELGENYVIAVLTEINEKGYIPLEKLTTEIRYNIRKDKKFDVAVSDFQNIINSSSTIEEISEKSGLVLHDLNDISIFSYKSDDFLNEPKLIGIASNLEEGDISTPIKGNAGVYIVSPTYFEYKINDLPALEKTRAYLQNMLYIKNKDIYNSLLENANVKDNRHNF